VKPRHTPLRFALVGLAATAVHLTTGITLIALGAPALLANVGAFVAAFGFSFAGHHFYSFRGHGVGAGQSFSRFAGVALIGFAINETVLAGLLLLIPDWPTPALVISTGTAALSTYVLSAFWAFRRAPD
jgi:putative flippase GtrA